MNVWRYLRNLIAWGKSSISDDGGPYQILQVLVGPYEIMDGRPNIQLFGLAGNPPAGTDVVLIYPSGDRSAGIGIASNHQASRPRGQLPGEVTLHNAFEMRIALTADGIVVDGGSKPLMIRNIPAVTVGAVDAPADLCVTGDLFHRWGSDDQVGLGTHQHDQGTDTNGDAEERTTAPVPGT